MHDLWKIGKELAGMTLGNVVLFVVGLSLGVLWARLRLKTLVKEAFLEMRVHVDGDELQYVDEKSETPINVPGSRRLAAGVLKMARIFGVDVTPVPPDKPSYS